MPRKKHRPFAALLAFFVACGVPGRAAEASAPAPPVGSAAPESLRRAAPPEEAAPDGGGGEAAVFRRGLLDATRADRWLVPTVQGDVMVVVEKGYLDDAALDRFCAELQEGVAAIPRITGRESHVRGRFTVYVYDRGPMSQTGVRGMATRERGLLLRFVRERRDPLFHELTHLLAGSSRSQSLSEGIAEVVQAQLRPGRANAFIRAGEDPDRNSVAALAKYGEEFRAAIGAPGDSVPLDNDQARYDFYFCSWSFVQFLLTRGSMADFWTIADAGGSDAAYQRVFGKTRTELVRDWAGELTRAHDDRPATPTDGK